MASKAPLEGVQRDPLEERREALRCELERRGVGVEFARAAVDALVPFLAELAQEEGEAVLSGIALAYGVHRRSVETFRKTAQDLEEVQRLMTSFSGELRKLDEALELLAAYAARLRAQTAPPRDRTLH